METDSIGKDSLGILIQFSLVPYDKKKGVKFGVKPAVLTRLHAFLTENRSELANLLSFAGRLTEIEISSGESDESKGESDDEESEEDLDTFPKVNVSLDVSSSEGLKQLGQFLQGGLDAWISERLVKGVKGLKYCTALLVEEYLKSVLKRVRSIEKQLKQQIPQLTTVPSKTEDCNSLQSIVSEPLSTAVAKPAMDTCDSAATIDAESTALNNKPREVESAASTLRELDTVSVKSDAGAGSDPPKHKEVCEANESSKVTAGADDLTKCDNFSAHDPPKGDTAADDPSINVTAADDPPKGDTAAAADDPPKGDTAAAADDPPKGDTAADDLSKNVTAADDPPKGDTAAAADDPTKGDTAADDPVKDNTAADDPTKGDTTTDDPTNGGAAADDPTKGDTTADDPTKGGAVAEYPTKGDTAADDPTKGDTAADDSTKGDTAADDPPKGNTAADDPPKGDTAADDPPKGDTAADDPPKGDTAADDPPKGDNAVDDPTKGDTAADDPPKGDNAVDDPMKGDAAADNPPKGDNVADGALKEVTKTDVHLRDNASDEKRIKKSNTVPATQATAVKNSQGPESKQDAPSYSDKKSTLKTQSKNSIETGHSSKPERDCNYKMDRKPMKSETHSKAQQSENAAAQPDTTPRGSQDVVTIDQLSAWEKQADFLALSEEQRSFYVPFEFRLYIVDIVKYYIEQTKAAQDPKFQEVFVESFLNSSCDITASLLLINTQLNKVYPCDQKIKATLGFYALPIWRIFIRRDSIDNFSYKYKLTKCNQGMQFYKSKHFQEYIKSCGHAVSAQTERTLNSTSISDAIVKSGSKRSNAPSDGVLEEILGKKISSDRLVCFDAFNEPHIDSVVGRPTLFWRIFASHATSLALNDAVSLLNGSDPAASVDQWYSALVGLWLRNVSGNDSKKALETQANEFNAFIFRILSSPFAGRFPLKPGGAILLCRISLFIHRRFAPENRSFWKSEEAKLLLGCFQKPALKGVSSQAIRFLDSSLPSFLSLCYCAKVLHPSASPEEFPKLIQSLGFVDRGGDKFGADCVDALIQSGLLRSLSATNFVSIACALFNEAEDFSSLKQLFQEFLVTKDANETLTAFESSACANDALKQWVQQFGSILLYKKLIDDLKNKEWQRFCDILPKVKKLQCVEETVWNKEVVPTVREAIVASMTSGYENDNSVPNRRALIDLLSAKDILNSEFSIQLIQTIFSSRSQWLIKLSVDIFESTFWDHVRSAAVEEKNGVICQFVRNSMDLYHKSASSVVKTLLFKSSTSDSKTTCDEILRLVLNEKALTLANIRVNIEDSKSTCLADVVFEVCWLQLSELNRPHSEKDDILKFFQHSNDAFDVAELSGFLCHIFGLSLENLLSSLFSGHSPTVFELLTALLERSFMWNWMGDDSNADIRALSDSVRQRIQPHVQSINAFAEKLSSPKLDKMLSLSELHQFVDVFSRLEKSHKLVRKNFKSSLYDHFDSLQAALLGNSAQTQKTRDAVALLEGYVESWNKQSAVVEQIFDFLFTISGVSSPLNLKLMDLQEKLERFQILKRKFSSMISAVGSDDLVFQIFEIRNVKNLELMKSLVKSSLFRQVFVKSNPTSGGSGSLFETQVTRPSELRSSAFITVQCSYVLDKMLPDASKAYKEFWTAVERGTLTVASIDLYIRDEQMDFPLEKEIVASLSISDGVIDKLHGVQQRDTWRNRVNILQYFIETFFISKTDCDVSTNKPDSSMEVSDDDNTQPPTFCKDAFETHEDASALIEEFLDQCNDDAQLREYLDVYNDVTRSFGQVDPNFWEVLQSLYDCRLETLPFLREQQSSDFQQLLDNTDETIAQDLSLSVINSLISLQQALRQFLSASTTSVKELEQSVLHALQYFVAADTDANIPNTIDQRQKAAKNLIDRLKECNGHINSIKALHASMGSRGETSKILALSVVNEEDSIQFVISTRNNTCISALKRTVGSLESEYSLAQLRDHRSRIIITLSSQKNGDAVEGDDAAGLKEFVRKIDILESAYEAAERLMNKGHPLFSMRTLDGFLSTLHHKLEDLLKTEKAWDETLKVLREEHLLANYVFGSNLNRLFETFYRGRDLKDVRNILHFMKIDQTKLDQISTRKLTDEELIASDLRCLFDNMFTFLSNLPKLTLRCFDSLQFQKSELFVSKGEILVCQLIPAEKDVISIFLNIWISSQNQVPWISEIVFCSNDTLSDEVILALHRSSREADCILFLVEVQNLRQKVLREVIAELIRQSSQKVLGRVAILCRAPESHSIFTVFRDNVVKAKALTEEKLKIVLKECFSNVFFCTSDRPSVGKSEAIIASACSKSHSFTRIHISGFVQKETVIRKLQAANTANQNILHIDVGSLQNADLLELILFEAVFCETLATAHEIVQFRPKKLYLEIANSIDKELEDSFSLFSSLPDTKCEWKNLKNLEVSEEPMSPTQIVCKYLYLMATNTVDTMEVNLTDCVPKNVCQNLLTQFFNHPLEDGKRPSEFMSFLVMESCTKILGEQLKKFTSSAYFKVKNIQLIYGSSRVEVRAKMVGLIMQSTLKLTLKSVASIKLQQVESRKNVYDRTVTRFRGLINWEESSYVLPVFMNQDISTVELIYRDLRSVSPEIRELFLKASSGGLVEFSQLDQEQLFEKLVKIAAKGQIGYRPILPKELLENYTLTADNFLKMILITLRVDADVPVIIIGETGCGKTSLIRYLAAVQECTLKVMNFHAGITEEDIIENISHAVILAHKRLRDFVECRERVEMVWMFLDEVNTCEHLGMLKEIICHRRFLDKEIPCNLRFIAACNPYILRSKSSVSVRAGLEMKELKEDKMTNLVYRVHPLPETMVELVWDFGRLTDADEQAYITRMVASSIPQAMLRKVISECLSSTQKFIRKLEQSEYATSLRDIRRFCEFYRFFIDYFVKKIALSDAHKKSNPSKRAFLFALYICYYVRIPDLNDRKKLALNIAPFFDKSVDEIQKEFMEEELEVLKRMRVPRKTARNLALRENVFIMFCCIYCQIPVFLVGKPGCSKSLAVNLIRSNLRGKDSEDPLFRQFPSLRFFSYQGSEASTSEGIRRVFSKAESSIVACATEDSKAVVLIDEIGLAEKSRYNPLKVLHSLLEPESSLDCKSRVSVVGISNWALDPAKMNRAIHISRPDMDEQELCETGKAICSSEQMYKTDKLIPEDVLSKIARACYLYFREQPFENFHGLRDFYYLLKYICDSRLVEENNFFVIREGILRNFNGDKASQREVMKHFEHEFPQLQTTESRLLSGSLESSTEVLIMKNLNDPQARHLMLIYESEGCLDLLCYMLSESKRVFKVMYGSQYEKDQYSEEFTYRKLNEVMMCMEQGMVLILKDFDLIYGSLYDMLNQNYSEYAGRKYCRIAMGVQANQNCVVHKDFRCIVLVSKREVRRLDPPFLNRFEKQIFDFEDKIVSMKLEKARRELNKLMDSLCCVSSDDVVRMFKKVEVFQGFSPDLVASYLIRGKQSDLESHQAVREILPQLYRHMFPDAVLRTSCVKLENSRQYQLEYFESVSQVANLNGVLSCIHASEEKFKRIYVYTKFSLYLEISKPLARFDTQNVKEIRLMDFSREIDLLDSIVPFFKEHNSNSLLLVRIKPSIDERYILHVRCLLDGLCQRYRDESVGQKTIVLIIHLQNEDLELETHAWNWSPLLDWEMFCVESLNSDVDFILSDLVSADSLSPVCEKASLMEDLHNKVFAEALAEAIRSPEALNQAKTVFGRLPFLESQIREFIVNEILIRSSKSSQSFSSDNWLVKLALETTQLANYSSFTAFVLHGIKASYKDSLIKILRALCDFGIFTDASTDLGATPKALPVILTYAFEKNASDRLSRVRGLKNLSIPFSAFLFGVTYDIFSRNHNDKNAFVAEVETLLREFLDDVELTSLDSNLANDLWKLITTAYCGRDRHASLRIVLQKQIDRNSQLMETTFDVLNIFKLYERDIIDLLNVHHHMRSLGSSFADDVVKDNFVENNEFSATLNSLLSLLLPTEDNLKNLKISDYNVWRRTTVSFLGMLRARNDGLECVPELEAMLKFCDFFVEHKGDVNMPTLFSDLKQRALLTEQDSSTQLLQWRVFANTLTTEDESSEQLISAEISFYYAVLSGKKLSETLVEEVLKKIFEGIIPVGFVSVLWKSIKKDSQNLIPLFNDLMESCKSIDRRSSIYSIITSFLSEADSMDTESLMEAIDHLRSALNKSLAISLSDLVDITDVLSFLKASLKTCKVTHNDFLCFGEHRDDMFAKINKLIQTSPVHPLWLAFLRLLRCRFSFGEIEKFLKYDRVTSVVSSLFRETFLRLGRGSEFIASYPLRYPFAVCHETATFQDALFAYQQAMLIKDWNEFEKLKQRLKNTDRKESESRFFLSDCLSAYVEMVGLRKAVSNFKGQEKQVTREVLNFGKSSSPDCAAAIKLLCGEVESSFDCFNLTPQCTNQGVCLTTLYYTGLLVYLSKAFVSGSLLHEISKNLSPQGRSDLYERFTSREKKCRQLAIHVRVCSCYNVTVCSENESDSNALYPCQFCQSEWTRDLSSKMVEFSDSFHTKVVTSVAEFICLLMTAIFIDIERAKSSSTPASSDIKFEDKFDALHSNLNLSSEETTWLIHSIIENREEIFFKTQKDAQTLCDNFMYFVGKHIQGAKQSIRDFKRQRLEERKVAENFALACLVDQVELADDQLPDELVPPGRTREEVKSIAANPLFFPTRRLTFSDACALFDCQLATGEYRPLLQLFMKFAGSLIRMMHATKLVVWHQTVLRKSENALRQEELEAMRIDDFLRRFRCPDALEDAAAAWRGLRPEAEAAADIPFERGRSLLASLLTERSEATRVLRSAVEGVNEFLEHVAVLCIEEKRLPELLCDDNSVLLPLCDVVSRPDSVPACSAEELDQLVRVLATCPGGGDPSVHWELLEAALTKQLLSGKGFGCVEPWEGRLKGATERDLGTLVTAVRQLCRCEQISEAELAAFQRRQKEDGTQAARTAALCRTVLGLCHRIGLPSADCCVADFLRDHAGQFTGNAGLAEVEAEGMGALTLAKVNALLEAAEQEQFGVICNDLLRRFSGGEDVAERILSSVPETDKPALMRMLKSACVRFLMTDSAQCGLTMADMLADASLQPVGFQPVRLKSDPMLDRPAVELLFPLANSLHKSELNKSKGQRKFQKLLNRM